MKDQTFEPLAGSGRTAYFDYLKLLQYFFLMVLHTASYRWYYTDIYSTSWLILNFYKCISRPCVLIFFMISGALMIGKDIPLKKLYRKYILQRFIVFIVWDIIYAVFTYWNEGPSGIIFKLFNSNYHLWYLLALIGLCICFPLINLIAENKKLLQYFLILSACFAFLLPTVFDLTAAFASGLPAHYAEMLSGHFYDMHMTTVMGYSFYFLAGYYIHKYDMGRLPRLIIYIFGIISVFSGILVNIFFVRLNGTPVDTFNNGFVLHEMLVSMAVFTFFKHNVKGISFLNRFVSRISDWGLGIYMVHDLVLLGLNSFFGLNAMTFNPVLAVPLVGLITFIASIAISALLNLIPWIKNHLV